MNFHSNKDCFFLLQETLEELSIPRVDINGGRKPRIVEYCIKKVLKPVVDFRESLFDRCFAIDGYLANRMIIMGYKFPSRFGRWCPVKVLRPLLYLFKTGLKKPSYFSFPVGTFLPICVFFPVYPTPSPPPTSITHHMTTLCTYPERQLRTTIKWPKRDNHITVRCGSQIRIRKNN